MLIRPPLVMDNRDRNALKAAEVVLTGAVCGSEVQVG